jgi:outer membrane autotransporter protein
VGGTIGAEYGFGNGTVGAAVNYSRPRVRFGRDLADIDTDTWQLGAYGGYLMNGFFGQGYVGYGWDSHDIERTGVVDNLKASPDGHHVTAGAKAGYLFPIWFFEAGPVVAIDYAKAKVDSYTEEGDAALSLNVSNQSLKSTRAQFGIEGRGSLIPGVRSYTTLTAERELSGDGRLIHFSQTSAPVIVNQWNVRGKKETYARLTSGASLDLWKGATLNYSMSSTFGQEDNELGLQIGFKAGF